MLNRKIKMGLSLDQVKPINEEFKQKYLFGKPYNAHVNSCSISNLRENQDNKKDSFDLRDGESLDDLCLFVTLRMEPPNDLDFPSEYKGVRVFYKVVGEIVL